MACNRLQCQVIVVLATRPSFQESCRELLHLKLYLLKIAPLSSFKGLRHSRWESHVKHEIQQLERSNQHRQPGS